VVGTLGDSGRSARAKLVAAIPSGINTTADSAAIRREKAMSVTLRPEDGEKDEPEMKNSSFRGSPDHP
jgi:hypothetical protein